MKDKLPTQCCVCREKQPIVDYGDPNKTYLRCSKCQFEQTVRDMQVAALNETVNGITAENENLTAANRKLEAALEEQLAENERLVECLYDVDSKLAVTRGIVGQLRTLAANAILMENAGGRTIRLYLRDNLQHIPEPPK